VDFLERKLLRELKQLLSEANVPGEVVDQSLVGIHVYAPNTELPPGGIPLDPRVEIHPDTRSRTIINIEAYGRSDSAAVDYHRTGQNDFNERGESEFVNGLVKFQLNGDLHYKVTYNPASEDRSIDVSVEDESGETTNEKYLTLGQFQKNDPQGFHMWKQMYYQSAYQVMNLPDQHPSNKSYPGEILRSAPYALRPEGMEDEDYEEAQRRLGKVERSRKAGAKGGKKTRGARRQEQIGKGETPTEGKPGLFDAAETMSPFQLFMVWFHEFLRSHGYNTDRLAGFGPEFDRERPREQEDARRWQEARQERDEIRDNRINQKLDNDDDHLMTPDEESWSPGTNDPWTLQDARDYLWDKGYGDPSMDQVRKDALLKHYFFGKPITVPKLAASLQTALDSKGNTLGVEITDVDEDFRFGLKWLIKNTCKECPDATGRIMGPDGRAVPCGACNGTGVSLTRAIKPVEDRKKAEQDKRRKHADTPNQRRIARKRRLKKRAGRGRKPVKPETDKRAPWRNIEIRDIPDIEDPHQRAVALRTWRRLEHKKSRRDYNFSKEELDQILKVRRGETGRTSAAKYLAPRDIIWAVSKDAYCPSCAQKTLTQRKGEGSRKVGEPSSIEKEGFTGSTTMRLEGDSLICTQCGDAVALDSIKWIVVSDLSDYNEATKGMKEGKEVPYYLIRLKRLGENKKWKDHVFMLKLEEGLGFDRNRNLSVGVSKRPNIPKGKTAKADGSIYHKVQEGDDLKKLAKIYYGDAHYSEEIYRANANLKMEPGQKLLIPVISFGEDNESIKETFRKLINVAKKKRGKKGGMPGYFDIVELANWKDKERTKDLSPDSPGYWVVKYKVKEFGTGPGDVEHAKTVIDINRSNVLRDWNKLTIDLTHLLGLTKQDLAYLGGEIGSDFATGVQDEIEDLNMYDVVDKGLAMYLETLNTGIVDQRNIPLQPLDDYARAQDRVASFMRYLLNPKTKWILRFPTRDAIRSILKSSKPQDTLDAESVLGIAKLIASPGSGHLRKIKDFILNKINERRVYGRPLEPIASLYGPKPDGTDQDSWEEFKLERLTGLWENSARSIALMTKKSPHMDEMTPREVEEYLNDHVMRRTRNYDFDFEHADQRGKEQAVRLANNFEFVDLLNALQRKDNPYERAIERITYDISRPGPGRPNLGIGLDEEGTRIVQTIINNIVGHKLGESPDTYYERTYKERQAGRSSAYAGEFDYYLDVAAEMRSLGDVLEVDRMNVTSGLTAAGREYAAEVVNGLKVRDVIQFAQENGLLTRDDESESQVFDEDTIESILDDYTNLGVYRLMKRVSDTIRGTGQILNWDEAYTHLEEYASGELGTGFSFSDPPDVKRGVLAMFNKMDDEFFRRVLEGYKGIEIEAIVKKSSGVAANQEEFSAILGKYGLTMEDLLRHLSSQKGFAEFEMDKYLQTVDIGRVMRRFRENPEALMQIERAATEDTGESEWEEFVAITDELDALQKVLDVEQNREQREQQYIRVNELVDALTKIYNSTKIEDLRNRAAEVIEQTKRQEEVDEEAPDEERPDEDEEELVHEPLEDEEEEEDEDDVYATVAGRAAQRAAAVVRSPEPEEPDVPKAPKMSDEQQQIYNYYASEFRSEHPDWTDEQVDAAAKKELAAGGYMDPSQMM